MDRHSTYTALLLRHRTKVWRMCWLRARGNWDRCCDLLQDVSIALWLNIDKLNTNATPGEESAWVRWQVRSVFEHIGRRKQLPTEPITATLADSLAAEDERRFKEDIEEVMSVLTPDEQRMLSMQLEGYHADEIADIMGLNRDAVYQRLHRAMSKAKRVLVALLLLLFTTTVAVAVVPQWRKVLFGGLGKTPAVEEEAEPTPLPVDTAALEPEPVITHAKPTPRERMEPMEHLEFMEMEYDEPLPPGHEVPTVSLDGNRLTVSGVYGERVSVYSKHGSLLASQMCNGICTFTLFPDDNMLTIGNRYGDIIVKIGDRPQMTIIQQ